jgi:hypothetical protein
MVTTARTAMRSRRIPALPKRAPLSWVLANKFRVSVGLPIPFDRYVDYNDVRKDSTAPQRVQFLNVNMKRTPHAVSTQPYAPFGPYFNR